MADIETRTLDIFLSAFLQEKKEMIWMEYHISKGRGGNFNLGIYEGSQKIADSVIRTLRENSFEPFISRVVVHNGTFLDGQKRYKLGVLCFSDVSAVLQRRTIQIYHNTPLFTEMSD